MRRSRMWADVVIGAMVVWAVSAAAAPDAVDELRQKVQANPGDVRTRMQLAWALQSQGKGADALREAEEMLKGTPDEQTLLRVSQLYAVNQRFDRAQQLLEDALRSPKSPEGVQRLTKQLATSVARQGPEELQAFITQAEAELAKDPGDLVARWKVIEGHVLSKRWPDAIERLKTLLAQTPNDETLRARLAQTYASGGQLEQGLQLLEEGLNASPQSLVLRDAVPDVYRRAGRTQDAIKQYEALIANSTSESRKVFYRSHIEDMRRVPAARTQPPASN